MLHLFLGCGFAPQCKSLIKLTKKRIEVTRRKTIATVKFLKEDIVALLDNGLDTNAYGRTEGVLAELAKLSCYDVVEGFCDFLLKHLSLLQKRRDCPEECRQAVSSLIFAAAIFSDLPELRYLRDVLCERYGDTLQFYVNQECIRYSSSKSFSMEAKIKLMEDIASDSSVLWDSKNLQQSLSHPVASLLEKPKIHRSCGLADDQIIKEKDDKIKQDIENIRGVDNGAVGDSTPKVSIDKLLQETAPQGHVLQDSTPKPEMRNNVKQEEEAHRTITYSRKHIPPPYTKPTTATANGSSGGAEASPQSWRIHEEKLGHSVQQEEAHKTVGYSKKYISPPYSKPTAAEVNSSISSSNGGDDPKLFHAIDSKTVNNKNVQNHTVSGDLDLASANITRRGRTTGLQRGKQDVIDKHQENDEEERMIEKLLIHYSKMPSFQEPSQDGPADSNSEIVPSSSRSISLPGEQTNSSEPASVSIRAASFHTHGLPSSSHVHPKLPNYDDLAAQVASLKGI